MKSEMASLFLAKCYFAHEIGAIPIPNTSTLPAIDSTNRNVGVKVSGGMPMIDEQV